MTPPSIATQPRVGTGFRLQWEPAQDCHVLLYPEGMVKLNQSGGEILKRCDGQRSVAAIVSELEQAFSTQGLGEDVLAFVALKAGATADAEALIAFCQGRLAKYKCPKQVRFLDALPKTPIGKILKKELRGLA